MKKAYTIVRVSGEDQLRGYGPDVQWYEDILSAAPLLGLEVSEKFKVVIQETATSWDRDKFREAVQHAMRLHREGKVAALLFPRVDRETRFIFGSFPLLTEVIRSGMEVYFARERLKLDPDNPESLDRYLSKAAKAQAYIEELRLNSMGGKKRKVMKDHRMPCGGRKWAFDYLVGIGLYRRNDARAYWVSRCYQWILEEGLSLRQCCLRLEREAVPSPGWEYWLRAAERGRMWQRKPPPKEKWYPNTLRNILLDPANIGKFYYLCHERAKSPDGRKRLVRTDPSRWLLVYEDPCQAIVTQDQYEALKLKLRLNYENSQRHNTRHHYPPLRGLVFCTLCQRRMVGWTNSSNTIPYYVCPLCLNRINARRLWEQLRNEIKAKLLEPDRLLAGVKAQLDNGQALSDLEAREKSLADQLENWEHARDKARRLYFLNRNYPEEKFLKDDEQMAEQQRKVRDELEQVRATIAELRQRIVDEQAIKHFCEEVGHNLDNLNDSRWRLLLEKMRVRIEATPGEPIKVKIALPSVSMGDASIAYQSSALSS